MSDSARVGGALGRNAVGERQQQGRKHKGEVQQQLPHDGVVWHRSTAHFNEGLERHASLFLKLWVEATWFEVDRYISNSRICFHYLALNLVTNGVSILDGHVAGDLHMKLDEVCNSAFPDSAFLNIDDTSYPGRDIFEVLNQKSIDVTVENVVKRSS